MNRMTALALLATPTLAPAAYVDVSYTGVVEDMGQLVCVDYQHGPCEMLKPQVLNTFRGRSVTLGDAFAGSFRLDTEAPEVAVSGDGQGGLERDYANGSLLDVQLQFSGLVLPAADMPASADAVSVQDGMWGHDAAIFTRKYLMGDGYQFRASLFLTDMSAQAFEGTALTQPSWDLGRYDQAFFFVAYEPLDGAGTFAYAQGRLATLSAVGVPSPAPSPAPAPVPVPAPAPAPSVSAVPEPSTGAALAGGLVALFAAVRRRNAAG
jgi:hypothetical protein